MAIAGKVGAVFIQTEDVPTTFVKEATQANIDLNRYVIINETCRYFDKNSPVTVYVNDIETENDYQIEHIGGAVVFSSPLNPEDVVSVSGKSINVSQAGGFFNWSAELSLENADSTTFEGDGWKENMPTIKGFTASAESYWVDERLSQRLGDEVIVAMYLDTGANKKRYEGYALLSSDSIEVSVDDVVSESIEFEGSEKLYYRED